jgi:hypothetical protein
VEKPEVGISYPMEKTVDFAGRAQSHFLLWLEDVGKRNFRQGMRKHQILLLKVHRDYYNRTAADTRSLIA